MELAGRPISRLRLLLLAAVFFFALLLIVVLLRRPSSRNETLPSGAGDGEGTATIEPGNPVEAGSRGTWTVRYAAGRTGIREGGGVVLHLPLYWDWTEPQTAAPSLPGYCTVACSDPDVRIEIYADPEYHYVRARVAKGRLGAGDTLRFVYGDTLGGSAPEARARADSYAEAVQEFLVKVDGDGDGFHEEIARSPSIEMRAGQAAQLRAYLKGETELAETTIVTVAALDRFGNRAVDYAGTVRFSYGDGVSGVPVNYAFRPEDHGARAFPIRFEAAGFHTIRVVEEGGALQATTNPIRARRPEEREPYRLLWGDIHQHSRLSDGTGEPEDLIRYAREVGNLDLFALTDHDHHGLRPLESSWKRIRESIAAAYVPDEFVTLLGYEWTNWTYGHRNVYYLDDEGPLFSFADSATNSPGELWAALPAGRAITIAHHTGGGPVPVDWGPEPPSGREPLVEISSIHGSSECFGCLKGIYNPVPGAFVQDALARGYRLGFIGSGDGHVGHPGETDSPCGGLAGVFAAGKTREDVWEALHARRTYATSGERIVLEVRLGARWMGEEVSAALLEDPLRFRFVVSGTAPIDVIELIENGAPVDTVLGAETAMEGTLEAPLRPGTASAYYVRVTQMDEGL
ncbi:MAG: DUF3604 domain-containing protein, partial [Candidatus Eisenbacteria bacterium]